MLAITINRLKLLRNPPETKSRATRDPIIKKIEIFGTSVIMLPCFDTLGIAFFHTKYISRIAP